MNVETSYDLEAMRGVDIRSASPAEFTDIRDINIDPSLPFAQKAVEYLRQCGGNAYCFRYGDMIVKISHNQTDITMNDCMESFFRTL